MMSRSLLAALFAACVWLSPPYAFGQSNTQTVCNKSVIYDASTNGVTQLVVAGGTILICGYAILLGGTATAVGLVYGTGTNCANGQTSLTPAWALQSAGNTIIESHNVFAGIAVPAGNALCVSTNTAQHVQARVSYAVP
jgi:hypothetical protein